MAMYSGDPTQAILAAGQIPQPPNPLQMLGQVQAIKNAQMENQLQQQSLLNSQQEQKNLELTNQTGQTALNNSNAGNYARATFGLLSLGADQRQGQAGYDNIRKVADDMLAKNPGASSENIHAQTISSLPPPTDATGKPTDYTPWLNQHMVSAAGNFSGPELMKLLIGDQKDVTLPGGMTQPTLVPGPLAPAGTPSRPLGQPIGGGMDPSAGATLVYADKPDGSRVQVPAAAIGEMVRTGAIRGQSADQTTPIAATPQGAVGGNMPMGGMPPSASVTPGGNLPMAGGPAPAATQQPAATQPPPQPPAATQQPAATQPPPQPPAAPGGLAGMTGGLKFGQPLPTDAQKTLAGVSRADDYTAMSNLSSKNYNDTQQSLQSILKLSPGVDTGEGTARSNMVKQVLTNVLPGVASTLGIDPNKSLDQQDLFKFLARAATANGAASDAQMFENISANPHAAMSPGAMQRATSYILGLNSQDSVITQETHALATHDPMHAETLTSNVRKQLQLTTDANAFREPYLSPEEQARYIKSLPNDAARRKYAYTTGLIDKYTETPAGMAPVSGQQQ